MRALSVSSPIDLRKAATKPAADASQSRWKARSSGSSSSERSPPGRKRAGTAGWRRARRRSGLDEIRHFDRGQHVVRAGRDAFLGTAARAAAARQGGAEAKKMNPNALDLDEVTGLPTQRPTAPLGRA
jgi:hypothetical protein